MTFSYFPTFTERLTDLLFIATCSARPLLWRCASKDPSVHLQCVLFVMYSKHFVTLLSSFPNHSQSQCHSVGRRLQTQPVRILHACTAPPASQRPIHTFRSYHAHCATATRAQNIPGEAVLRKRELMCLMPSTLPPCWYFQSGGGQSVSTNDMTNKV